MDKDLNIEALMKEYKMLEDQLEIYDNMYEEVKETLSDRWISEKKREMNISHIFYSSQTNSLISIMDSKTGIINDMANIRRTIEDFKLKYIKLNEGIEQETDSKLIISALKGYLLSGEPIQDLDEIIPADEDYTEDYSSDAVGEHLESLYVVGEDGEILPKDEVEAQKVALQEQVTEANKVMELKSYVLQIDLSEELMYLQQVKRYRGEDIYLDIDYDELQEEYPDLYDFLDNPDLFYIDDNGDYHIPDGFLVYEVIEGPDYDEVIEA